MTHSEIDAIIDRYEGKESSILAILQDIQAKEKYLPKETLELVGERLRIPINKIYRIATFYRAFSLTPRGLHEIQVCLGTACHVRGGIRIVDRLMAELGIRQGETTPDRKFTLETVNCLGVCASGPIMVVDGHYFGKMSAAQVKGVLGQFDTDKKESVNEKD
ncbi:MAG: complex I 24 kDa subunit family protein [Thermodesulfobacteriota bacterium]